MMGSEDSRGFTSTDAMESLILESSLPHADYQSNATHPLASLNAADDDDPLSENFRMPFAASSKNVKKIRDDPFLEPPAYTDVVFSPYVGENATNGSSGDRSSVLPLSSSLSSFSEYLNITVSQPQKVQDSENASLVPGTNTYVTYLIHTKTNIPRYGGQEFSVRRRFRDVVTLADKLSETFRGYLIPARPDKSVIESQVMHKQEFIEQRRVAIEKYLRRLANHPVIRLSDELRLFLQSQGKLPLIPTTDIASRVLDGAANLPRQLFGEASAVITPQDVVQPAKGGRDLVRMFKELRQSVTIEWGGVKPAVSEEDKDFLEKKEKLDVLEHKLSDASKQAEAFIKTQQEVGEVMGELGLAFIKIAKFESEEAISNTQRTHAADTKRLATATVKASRLYREDNAQSVKYLDTLHEYLSLMQSIHAAFNDRSTSLLTLQTLITEISTLNSRIEKLTVASSKVFGGDKTRNRKVEELKEALITTQQSRDTAASQYEKIKEINKTELERFDSERQRDFLEMLKGFVHNQVLYSEKIASVWTKAAEEYTVDGKSTTSSLILSSPKPS